MAVGDGYFKHGEEILLSVLIPVYREQDNIVRVLDAVTAAPLPEGVSLEIVAVDDGSPDRSPQVLTELELSGRYPLRVFAHPKNVGKGFALRTAIQEARGQILLVQDADLEYDPADYVKLLEPLIEGRARVVYGSRFLGSISGMRLLNRVANRILSFTASVLYGQRITDQATCYKLFRKDVLDSITLNCLRFEFCPEVTARVRKKGIRILEIPITYKGRSFEEGKKITWKDGVEALWTLIRYRFTD